MPIKAIETSYNGYKFRSRLEARWAVFFEAMDIEYQYEPEGFEIDDGEDKVFYLPDFYLPKEHCYVEVKGTDEALHNDGRKIALAVDFGNTPCSNGLLILGDIPDPTKIKWGNIPMFSYLRNDKGIVHEYAIFMPYMGKQKLFCGSDEIVKQLFSYDDWDFSDAFAHGTVPNSTSTKCHWSYDDLESFNFQEKSLYWYKLTEAYTKARQARFEHGEKP